MLQRYELTGRMKDFYDIYYLSKIFDFDGVKLKEAILKTLQQRGTIYNSESFKRIMELNENEDIQKRWKYFLKGIKDNVIEFSIVITGIERFLEPVFYAIVNEDKWSKQWDCGEQKWV